MANTLATLGQTPDPGRAYETERDYQQPPIIDWSRFFVDPRDTMAPRVGYQYSTPMLGGELTATGALQPFAPLRSDVLRDLGNIPIDRSLMLRFQRRF